MYTYEYLKKNKRIDSFTYTKPGPSRVVGWLPELAGCPHSSAIARMLKSLFEIKFTNVIWSVEYIRGFVIIVKLTSVIGVPAVYCKLLSGGNCNDRWQRQLRISVGRDMTDRRVRRKLYCHANVIGNTRKHHRWLKNSKKSTIMNIMFNHYLACVTYPFNN